MMGLLPAHGSLIGLGLLRHNGFATLLHRVLSQRDQTNEEPAPGGDETLQRRGEVDHIGSLFEVTLNTHNRRPPPEKRKGQPTTEVPGQDPHMTRT